VGQYISFSRMIFVLQKESQFVNIKNIVQDQNQICDSNCCYENSLQYLKCLLASLLLN